VAELLAVIAVTTRSLEAARRLMSLGLQDSLEVMLRTARKGYYNSALKGRFWCSIGTETEGFCSML